MTAVAYTLSVASWLDSWVSSTSVIVTLGGAAETADAWADEGGGVIVAESAVGPDVDKGVWLELAETDVVPS